MKRVLVDVKVILDVLLDREPHATASSAVWAAVETGSAEGLLTTHAVTTIHYLIRKDRGVVAARRILDSILRVFGVAAVDGTVIQAAMRLPGPDFEDSVSAAAAQLAGCDLIITRDPRRFPSTPLRALAPEAAAPLFAR